MRRTSSHQALVANKETDGLDAGDDA